ncbi:beta-galactosidase [Clostridium chauvoei]|uniref:Beta-galactosidase n=2 Tax=Clostridium chauvoei TaxID=46867 RepID=S6F1M4_9CLOT|nr:beta-galactosidase [Clostridium chauvoei]ATD55753.1 beta-galactosidase [Clostridium chauvoei]ATD56571.1 beta-galactosidase [Clostridium chauvoei]MBX7280298.1 beta-galactosidase [Clostridium chauvoei]MBX7282783.1 beta-galactosidase [Clostridium chauvoei]MBX7285189.1 beta-galactosidase [Clostridium chauvoei]
MKNYGPISSKINKMLHGADYNPEQWIDVPGIWGEDVRLMKLSHSNVVAVGIFSWTMLEPEEGKFNFEWLDEVMDLMHKNGNYVILATPSGAKPIWMAHKYPETLRVAPNRVRNLYGERHNHCYTSPIYREKIAIIDRMLAERYKDHPALIMWHISNEFEGQCSCPLCEQAFREFLKEKYDNSLEKLNEAWWTKFWSHTYGSWDEIEAPAPHGEPALHGLNLDWMRFVTHQTLDYYKHERSILKEITPDIPVTTNFHDYVSLQRGIDYWKFAPYLDVVSWDNYPYWHGERSDDHEGSRIGFVHDLNRALLNGKPFMMMESSPSSTNWQPVAKLRRPGMHVLSSIQAVAHGSDTVQYFQWRKSRGSSEKFHGAVVDHCGHENTRVFRDVTRVGEILSKLNEVIGTSVEPEVAVIYDWENFWAIDDAQGPRIEKKDYYDTCQKHYKAFWDMSVPVDVINMDCDFSKYRVVVAPMLYLVRPGVGERLEEFVNNGGTLITTYWSGIVNENDLCFLNGFPGPLRKVTGIWAEELDALYDEDVNYIAMESENSLTMKGEYEARIFCDLIHAEGAEVLATYKTDFYKGRPALTCNKFGKGEAYYIAFRNNDEFLRDFYRSLAKKMKLEKAIDLDLPTGVNAQVRRDEKNEFVFLLNFSDENKVIDTKGMKLTNVETGEKVGNNIEIESYGVRIFKK